MRWLVFLKAMQALPLTHEEQAVFRHHTGRASYSPPTGGYPEACVILGCQSGKSQIAALVGVYEAMQAVLSGQRNVYVPLIAQDLRGAQRALFGYVKEAVASSPILKQEVARETNEGLELTGGVTISVYPCRPAAIRGIRAACVIIDEWAFFISTDGRPTDVEMLRAARTRTATTHGRLLILSSPYASNGALYELHRNNFGVDNSSVLVWQGSAPEMNPTLSSGYLERMAETDPEAYRSEVLGEFRTGISTLLDPENLADCVDGDVKERPFQAGCHYGAFADPASGTGKDRFVVAIGHYDPTRKCTIVDALRCWSPPFNPSGVIEEAAAFLKSYNLESVTGDRYGLGFVAEQFRDLGISYRYSDLDRSEIYLHLLPLVNAHNVRLLDIPELLRELRGLERRRGPSGKDRVDHRSGAHDDLANACAGAVVLVAKWAAQPPLFWFDFDLAPKPRSANEIAAEAEAEHERRREEGAKWLADTLERDRVYFPGD